MSHLSALLICQLIRMLYGARLLLLLLLPMMMMMMIECDKLAGIIYLSSKVVALHH